MLWKIKIPMAFTFEVSNGLYETKENKSKWLDRGLLMNLGSSVL